MLFFKLVFEQKCIQLRNVYSTGMGLDIINSKCEVSLASRNRYYRDIEPTVFWSAAQIFKRSTHLSKSHPGLFKAPHLKSLFNQIKGIRDRFTDDSSTTTADQTV